MRTCVCYIEALQADVEAKILAYDPDTDTYLVEYEDEAYIVPSADMH